MSNPEPVPGRPDKPRTPFSYVARIGRVEAVQIAAVVNDDEIARLNNRAPRQITTLHPKDRENVGPIVVDAEFMSKNGVVEGGYYCVNTDTHTAFFLSERDFNMMFVPKEPAVTEAPKIDVVPPKGEPVAGVTPLPDGPAPEMPQPQAATEPTAVSGEDSAPATEGGA